MCIPARGTEDRGREEYTSVFWELPVSYTHFTSIPEVSPMDTPNCKGGSPLKTRDSIIVEDKESQISGDN